MLLVKPHQNKLVVPENQQFITVLCVKHPKKH